ncbi:LOW QUALITY PROTEIN: uncharacterized protein LOC128397284 [Panonychus citri]|uniref:LOW QUALITY PROTEIN: uncharacterized protein LOC128397284 n=1 Tax=Panonychus citri TaxID=50023 RepID=UPI002307302C|nr:LOW QUALITY PROTEIN: uncharacterized protein LOC128397284 [Panonychus citri]
MSSTNIFDLQLYPCANGQCLHQSTNLSRTKADLINYLTSSAINSSSSPITGQQSVNSKMIDDWNKSKSMIPINITSDINSNHNLSDSVNGSISSPVWIPIPSLGLTLRSESWVIPLLSLASINILLILLLESLVIFRVHRKTSKPPQLFLGQTLLLALFLTSLHGYFTLLSPTTFICTLTTAGLGLGYSLIFGTLLVKSIFLLSLHSGTYLPLLYQFLLLFFIMSTQVILSIQGILASGSWDNFKFWPTFDLFFSSSTIPSSSSVSSSLSASINPESRISIAANSTDDHSTTNSSSNKQIPSSISTYSLCSSSPTSDTYYYSLSYNILLLLLVSIISFRIRRHRENYREALFITISGLSSILVWILWITGYLVSRDSGPDAFIGFGLQINSLIVFLVMFTPKAKQLIKLSWIHGDGDSGEPEDEEDYCDEDCEGDTMRRSLGQTMVGVVGGRHLRGGRSKRQRGRRETSNTRSGEIGNILCSAEYSGHDSNQSLCAQSFVHLNPNYLLPIVQFTTHSTNNNLLHYHHQYPHIIIITTTHQDNKPNHLNIKSIHLIIIFSIIPIILIIFTHLHHHPNHQSWTLSVPMTLPGIIRNPQQLNHHPTRTIILILIIDVYTNSLLKSLADDSFAFYRIPPIKSIYLNNR